jgi:acyl carrier protein
MSERDDVVRIIRDVSPTATIRADQYGDSLLDLGLDSLDHATILLQVEEKFGVKIPDDELANLRTVGDAVSYIEKAQALA